MQEHLLWEKFNAIEARLNALEAAEAARSTPAEDPKPGQQEQPQEQQQETQ